jgi:MoxR-like ATPase
MHPDAIDFHHAILAEGAKALVGYETPKALANVVLLSEIKSHSAQVAERFLESLQDRTITIGRTTHQLPAFSFAIATMNPVELGQGTFPLTEAATDLFAAMINIGYLPPEEEEKLVAFDFKHVCLRPLLTKQRIIALRARINDGVFLHERIGKHIQRRELLTGIAR